MPYISEFYGITIRMFFDEHNPPHFHAFYQGQKGQFDFNGKMMRGTINKHTALELIKKWTLLNKDRLVENWENIENGVSLNKIEPLE